MQTEMQLSLDCKASLPSDNISIKEGDPIITSSTTSIDPPLQSVKKPTRQWAAWTRQEEESFFNALRQVGKNFEKITSCVQSKNKDQVRHYYYRLVRRMNKLLGPGLSLDAKNSKDTNAAMLRWWSLLEKYSCKASKLHLKPRRFKIFVEALEHQLLKDRRKNLRKRPAQGDNCISTSPKTGQNDSKISGPEALSVKLVIVDSQNIQRVGSGKGSSLKRNANMGINRSNNKGNSSTVTTSKQRRKPGAVSSAAYKRWEKAAIAGVSLVADAAEHLERTSINAKNNLDHGPTDESFPRPVVSTNGSVDKVLQFSIPSEHQIMENSVQPFVKLKLQLFPIDDETKRALEKDEHNPHLELTLSARKRISSVLEHLNRKWGDSSVASGDLMLFPYSVQRENLVAYQRWTQDTFASAADVYAIMGSPSVFRLRYGWFSDPELGSSTSAAHSSSNIQEEHRSMDVFNDNELAVDVAAVPALPAGQDAMELSKEQINLTTKDTALMSSYRDLSEEMTSSAETSPGHNLPSSEHQANSSLLGKETVNGRRWEDMDNLRLSNGTTLSAGEWADSLTTISIGDLLSEGSHDASIKLQASGSSQCLLQIPFSCDSLDAAFAAHLSGDQGNMGDEPAHVSNTSSIWDAEETCDGFSFRKISALDQEIPCSSGITTLGASKEIPGASSMGFQGLVEEIPEVASLDDPDGEVNRSDNGQSCLHSSDGSGKNLTEFNDIYWPDSLGPIDLDIPSSRYLSEDIILGDSVSLSGLNRLLASSLDALQNCSFFGLDKKEPSSVIEAPEYKIGG